MSHLIRGLSCLLFSIKRELKAKTNLFLFESIGIVDYLCKVFFLHINQITLRKIKYRNEEKSLEKV